jgi:hypothetical protein
MCDFSHKQQKNVAAVVCLYRGRSERFIKVLSTILLSWAGDRGRRAARGAARSHREKSVTALIEPVATTKEGRSAPRALGGGHATLTADIEDAGKEAAVRATPWRAIRDNAGPDRKSKANAGYCIVCS